jgi:hypothetical protein
LGHGGKWREARNNCTFSQSIVPPAPPPDPPRSVDVSEQEQAHKLITQ